MFDPGFVPERWYYFKSCDVAELSDEIIDITVERSLQIESPLTSYPIWQMGGAVGRVGEDETAFNGRKAAFTYNIGACTETSEGFDDERDWVRSFWSALEPWHQGVYVNFLGDEGAGPGSPGLRRRRSTTGCRALKQKYDPDNFFRINQNILAGVSSPERPSPAPVRLSMSTSPSPPLPRRQRTPVLDVFAGLSERSRRLRFLGPKPRLPERDVDAPRRRRLLRPEAVVAIDGESGPTVRHRPLRTRRERTGGRDRLRGRGRMAGTGSPASALPAS